MSRLEYGNPNPLLCASGGFWIEVEGGEVRIGGYTQEEAWARTAGDGVRARWSEPQETMRVPEFIELILYGRDKIDWLEKRNKELSEEVEELERENRELRSEIDEVKRRWRQSRRTYRRKIKKLISML